MSKKANEQLATLRLLILVSVYGFVLGGCDKIAQNIPFTRYENDGIIFSSPFYWSVSEEKTGTDHKLITVSGPLGSAILLSVYPSERAITLSEYSRMISESFKALDKVYGAAEPDIEFTVVEDIIGGQKVTGIREIYYDNPGAVEAPLKRDYFLIGRKKSVVYLLFQIDEESRFDRKLLERIKDSFAFQ